MDQGTQESLNRNENFKDPGPSSVRQGALNGLLCGPKADTLEQVRSASSSVAQSTEQELGEDKEECPQGGGLLIPIGGWEAGMKESASGRTWEVPESWATSPETLPPPPGGIRVEPYFVERNVWEI